MPDPHTMTVLQFATSILDRFTIDPDQLLTVPGGETIEAWRFLTEKILDAVDEVESLLEKTA
jgi:hypothetical protein